MNCAYSPSHPTIASLRDQAINSKRLPSEGFPCWPKSDVHQSSRILDHIDSKRVAVSLGVSASLFPLRALVRLVIDVKGNMKCTCQTSQHVESDVKMGSLGKNGAHQKYKPVYQDSWPSDCKPSD